ncbi:MAG: TatD family hydrolase [Proteobacteria bacterium]|nr:TatD family hydrolase [Pseudomonadota bacterium]MBU1545838.1 TatD family hydrolase [Pseudomonadota bacterium]MBU2618674.1 TatD family hydrolase [Pseudomonadota bacterium]
MEKTTRKIEIALPVPGNGAVLIDTHCHLDMSAYAADYDAVLARASAAGVTRIITVGIDLESSRRAIALAEQHQGIYATVGVHPHNVAELGEESYTELRGLCSHPRVVAYGEIGLDYVKNYAPIALQKEHFARQVTLAKELQLPLVVHDREAHDDVMEILEAAGPFPAGGVMHCFSGDAVFARRVLALGFYISIPGVVTFAKAEMLHEAVREIPLASLVLETDGPFLAPVPKRGRRNEPQLMLFTAQKVAELKGVSLEEVARQTTINAVHLFGLEGR